MMQMPKWNIKIVDRTGVRVIENAQGVVADPDL